MSNIHEFPQGNRAVEVSRSPGQQQPSATPQPGARTERSERLRPASEKAGNSELLSCLILVAPSGMTAEDRDAWLRAAKMTLTGMPADLLAYGCKVARETCRFASEIVPTIIEETRRSWEARKQSLAWEQAREANKDAPRLEHADPDYVTPEEAREIIKQFIPGALRA